MVAKFKIVAVLFLLGINFGYAQQLISYTSINHTEAYIGQPVQMTVSVYSNTWFTKGVDVGNIQVEGALTVYFRSVSNTRTFSGKQFAGVDFIYNVFPTQEGVITIPELTIHVESPKPGGYEGIKHTIHTKPKAITVKGVPPGYNPNNWLVSSTLNVNEKWNVSIKKVKVGDVLQRSIHRSASGTLGEFIPAVVWDSVAGVSIYPKRPSVNTNKTKTYVSASRTDGANYLFEKEGDVTLPRIEFVYWNYNNRKFYKKVIDSVTIHVEANPDLSMLAGIKKQLEAEATIVPEEEQPFLILGLTVKTFVEYLVLGILLLYILYKLLPWLFRKTRARYKTYHASEHYAFRNLVRSLEDRDEYKILNHLKIWLLKLDSDIPSMQAFITVYGNEALKKEYNNLEERANGNTTAIFSSSQFKTELKAARARYLKRDQSAVISKKNTKISERWLNPMTSEKRF
ncbi:BatD family protein [Formosa sp. PL04]|uniref:BatD family protein n=1 Tax=Formosa sp. PL04 TaxID=3081755 RepID=UPI00298186C1|nr:BatD family protein [Formosa sp. PL04]MDW5287650.1 BatD family protein [Formosa sp. PL04]